VVEAPSNTKALTGISPEREALQQRARKELRERYLERMRVFVEETRNTILAQQRRVGASADWGRLRFTMDEGLSAAVAEVFVRLYQDGLIYRGQRLVNWDPKLLTAISDLEVIQVETKGHLWYLRYPLEGRTFKAEDPSTYIVVATTRPETMLGDTAVAVNPEDDRYKALIGTNAILPLVGRKIPIVGDEISDPEKGSGAVKITPAHDFNDFEVGKRHDLPQVSVLDTEGKLALQENTEFNEGLPPSGDLAATLALHGLDRFVARKKIVAAARKHGIEIADDDKIAKPVH